MDQMHSRSNQTNLEFVLMYGEIGLRIKGETETIFHSRQYNSEFKEGLLSWINTYLACSMMIFASTVIRLRLVPNMIHDRSEIKLLELLVLKCLSNVRLINLQLPHFKH
uniref:Uncharacterized protein n=2 Tax=Aegilops tauschii subsp. strangulata TaxID=200361 RepID=A0A453FT33_AEGTS